MSVHILCDAHKAVYKITQKTGTDLASFLEYGMSGQIVGQKCSVLFLCFFFSQSSATPSNFISKEMSAECWWFSGDFEVGKRPSPAKREKDGAKLTYIMQSLNSCKFNVLVSRWKVVRHT